MALTLTTISGSPRGWRVLLGLAFKGLSAEINLLRLSKAAHKSESFLALNPRGTVPVLECDGMVLRDSMAILAWLDRRFPDQPLFGSTAHEAAEIWQTTMECRDYLRRAAADLLTPVFFGGASLAEMGTPAWPPLLASAKKMQAEMRFLDALLADGRAYLTGAAPSAADAVAWPEIRLMQRACEIRPELMAELGFAELTNALTRLEAWKSRVFALPGVDQTMPPHWQSPS